MTNVRGQTLVGGGQPGFHTGAEDDEAPPALQRALDQDGALRAAFDALTPGRQHSYFLHIGGAKQAKTRVARVEKCRDKIFDGKGFNEY
ncbi:MAG: YdeI/OmpD-associated family protein [Saccharospirillum sp.]